MHNGRFIVNGFEYVNKWLDDKDTMLRSYLLRLIHEECVYGDRERCFRSHVKIKYKEAEFRELRIDGDFYNVSVWTPEASARVHSVRSHKMGGFFKPKRDEDMGPIPESMPLVHDISQYVERISDNRYLFFMQGALFGGVMSQTSFLFEDLCKNKRITSDYSSAYSKSFGPAISVLNANLDWFFKNGGCD